MFIEVVVWTGILLGAAYPSVHLRREMGILVGSQGVMMSLAGLLDVVLLRAGVDAWTAMIIVMSIGVFLGLLHIPLLLVTSEEMFLLLTVLSQLALIEFWFGLPSLTGGSGGLLYPSGHLLWPAFGLLLVGVGGLAAYDSKVVRKVIGEPQWAAVRHLGRRAGSVGVPAEWLYTVGLGIYGGLLAVCGLVAARLLEYVVVSSFSLAWVLAVIMITLVSERRPLLLGVPLCVSYSVIEVVLRQTIFGSTVGSTVFHILFPLVLWAVWRLQKVKLFSRLLKLPDEGQVLLW